VPEPELVVVDPPAPVLLVASVPPVVAAAVLPPPQPGPAAQARASVKGISAAIRGSAREDEVGRGSRGKEIRISRRALVSRRRA
jgi:hypothetical protein